MVRIIGQTLFNNNDGKVCYAEQIYDRNLNCFQSDINELMSAEGVGEIIDKLNTILDKLDDFDRRIKKFEDFIII